MVLNSLRIEHDNIRLSALLAPPEAFRRRRRLLETIGPYRDDLVVAAECMFTWYWLADVCAAEGVTFVLGHALAMKAIHGGKAKNTSANTKLGLFGKERFQYDPVSDVYQCPAGETLTYRFAPVEQGRSIRYYSTSAWSTCLLKPQCTRNKENRRITRWEDEAVLERMEQRVSEHPEVMRTRKSIVEHPFGTIKRWMDQSYFLMRGKDKVSGEASLTVLAYNMRRVINILGVTPLVRTLA